MHATANRRRVGARVAAVVGALTWLLMSTVIPGSGTTPAHAATPRSNATSSALTGSNNLGMQVSISQTQNLQPRQSVTLNWSKATPTTNYSVTDVPGSVAYDEFPVDIMECWGSDTSTAPMDPTHCFGGSASIATKIYNDTNATGFTNPPATNGGIVVGDELGFTSVTGVHYTMAGQTTTPTDFLSGSGVFPNYDYAWTGADGTRTGEQFEVRTAQQYPSLGCSDTQACTIEVVPITKPTACVAGAAADCAGTPHYPVGVGNIQAYGNKYVSAPAWWLTTNWAHRIPFGITIAPQPSECSTGDTRTPVPVSGSELAYNAMYSWVPEFCLDPSKFNLSYVSTSEPLARQQLTTNAGTGYGANAILSSLPVKSSPRPVVHAPVAVTGFAVTFLIDNATHTQITTLNLTPLLLAKLITDSYPGPSDLISEPVLDGNPKSLFTDPEFLAINPGFSIANNIYTGMNMIMFGAGDQSDVIWALTSYVNADPEARAWLNGAPDAYSGMTVNPAYRGMSLPELATSLLDSYAEPTTNGQLGVCEKADPTPDQLVYSQPVNNMLAAATAMLNRQSPATASCLDSPGTPAQWTTFQQQGIGSRALLALTTVPFAEEYGLPVANLQVHELANGQRLFAAPTVAGLTSALAYATEDSATGVLSLDYPHLAANAYPGAMPVYAVVPTYGLDKTTARDYGQFLTYAATDGQIQGEELGELPAGYAPLTGALAAMSAYTAKVAADVTAQDGAVPTPPQNLGQTIGANLGEPSPTGAGTSAGSAGGGSGLGSTGTGGSPSATSAAPTSGSGKPSSSVGVPQTVALTRGTSSWLADWGLPLLLGVGLLAGVLTPLVRWGGQPGHPVRVALARLGRRLRDLFSRRRV